MRNSHPDIPDQKSLPHQKILGFFCGTGYDFHPESKGYINQQKLGYPEPKLPNLNIDNSLDFLDGALQLYSDPNTIKIFGYDGCHRRGGGINATGIEQPAQHLYQHLKTLNPNTKVTLILTAHSRGCLSALLLSQLIHSDPQLRNNVEIILDLRDPVPGNLKGLSTLLGNLTSSGKFYDFSENKTIKSARITVQESGIGPIGFNVLIPHFSSATHLSISDLPGIHDLQQRDEGYTYVAGRGYTANAGIYQLGLYKSLQLYLENHVPISIELFISEMKKLHQTRIGLKKDEDETILSLTRRLFDLQHKLVENTSSASQNKPESIIRMLKTAQFLIYEWILKDYTINPQRTLQPRDITFGGQSKRTNIALEDVRYLNEEHYQLAKELFPDKPHEHKLFIMLDGIKPHIVQAVGTKLVSAEKEASRPNTNAFFVQPNPAQTLTNEMMQLLDSQGIKLDKQSDTKSILDFVMIKLIQIREQAKLFLDDDGNTKSVYQPLLDKIEKFIGEKEKTLLTYLESKFEIERLRDEKALSPIDQNTLNTRQAIIKNFLAKFQEEKQHIIQLGNELKYRTAQLKKIEPFKNKILLNAQEIINLIAGYKTTDSTTQIGHEKNALAFNLKNYLEKIKNDFIKFPDATKFENEMNQAIESAIKDLKESAVSKSSSTVFADKKDRSTRLLDLLLKVQLQMQSSSMIENLKAIKSIELKVPDLKDQKAVPKN